MKKAIGIILALALLGGGIVGGLWGWRYYYDRKKPNFSRSAELWIYPGTPAEAVMDSIAAKAGVLDRESLERAFRAVGEPRPGHYSVSPELSSMALARRLSKGQETPVNLTIAPNYRTAADLAEKMGTQLMIGAEPIAAAFRDPAFLSRYGFKPETALALVLPDTYNIKWSVTVEELFDRLAKEYQKYWNDGRRALATEQELTPVEVAILAAIVNEETKYQPEMAKVAGVYLNRLHTRGWKLQADPTVAYCFGYTLTRVLNKHLEVDSPYNTYRYDGLPPGMISCAPKVCIEAVLHPSAEPNYFFCADPANFQRGPDQQRHVFCRTAREHSQAAARYHAAENAAKRKK